MIYINVKDKWEVLLFTDLDDSLLYYLKEFGFRDLSEVFKIKKLLNSGFTYSNMRKKVSIVYISKTTSKAEWFSTLIHELKHVLSDICKYYNVSESGEDAAYLIGYLMKQVAQLWYL